MDAGVQREDNTVSSLNVAIDAMNLAKEIANATPARAVFGTVAFVLTTIKDTLTDRADFVELGIACADVCKALDRGMNGKKLEDLSQPVREALDELAETLAKIEKKVTEKSKQVLYLRLLHSKNDNDTITARKADLARILGVFNAELVLNTDVIVSETHRDVSKIWKAIGGRVYSVQTSIPGEFPPPPPTVCFGRDGLIEEMLGHAENLAPVALVGVGGIGKTTIALSVLHHDRIKERFGDDRRFIRCDQFPASLTHFLDRLSKAIGAGIENPEDLTPLRDFLSSKKMIIVLNNAESILDPQIAGAQEIYAVVEELSQFSNICLFITSRISIIPPACKILDVPTLLVDAARDIFYHVCENSTRSNLIDTILEQLDFHPLSITLLAAITQHNKWDTNRLVEQWKRRGTDILQTQHNKSLAATIEISLASLMFQGLCSDARGILEVVAFFPQGVNEKNLDWLFPTISDKTDAFDNFCILSLTYRSNGFFKMLAPLRDYLCPRDPASSPLLRTAKECYFRRLSVDIDPGMPGFEEAQWIGSEDVNVEYLLDVFTSIDADSAAAWDTYAHFMRHLYWHKPRLAALGPKVERLPDGHRSKPDCLFNLSRLFGLAGNHEERKRLLVYTLKLWRERGEDYKAAQTLGFVSNTNRLLGLRKEGILEVKEASEIYEQLNCVSEQAQALQQLASLLYEDKQLDAAEEAASRATELLLDESNQISVCECHRVLGKIYRSRGETEKAIKHFETALEIASSSNRHTHLFWNNYSLAELFLGEKRFDDAHVHISRAKSYAINAPHLLGHARELEAVIWYKEHRLEEAKSEALRAADTFETLGATKQVEVCRKLLQRIENGVET